MRQIDSTGPRSTLDESEWQMEHIHFPADMDTNVSMLSELSMIKEQLTVKQCFLTEDSNSKFGSISFIVFSPET